MKQTAVHTVIYTHGGGRLGNQIIRFLHWIAWVRSVNAPVEVVNLAFWPYAELFAVWRDNPASVFPIRATRVHRLARIHSRLPKKLRKLGENRARLGRLVQEAGCVLPGWQVVKSDGPGCKAIDLGTGDLLRLVEQRRVTVCSGWWIRSWELVAREEASLRGFLRPAPEWEQKAAARISRIRHECDFLVGVLIRQTDYRVWSQGRFFFETEQYSRWMRRLMNRFPERRVIFLIASDEPQNPLALSEVPHYFANGTPNAGGHWFESWIELSKCDLILSAPSTFSATAAYVGNVPLCCVTDLDGDKAEALQPITSLTGASMHFMFRAAVQ